VNRSIRDGKKSQRFKIQRQNKFQIPIASGDTVKPRHAIDASARAGKAVPERSMRLGATFIDGAAR